MNIIVDIDGTIADCRHRRKFLEGDVKDWQKFYAAMSHDKPIEPVCKLVNELIEWHRIIFCTGRPVEYRIPTVEWLDKYIYKGVNWNDLVVMRKTGDYRPDYEVKEEMLGILRQLNIHPDLAIDDKEEVVQMWRRNGIITLQNSMKELP